MNYYIYVPVLETWFKFLNSNLANSQERHGRSGLRGTSKPLD